MTIKTANVSMADKVALIDQLCAQARILPVITIARKQDILPLADALAAGGLTALEVTLRSQFGLEAIRVLREQRPELVTGAGTVLDRHMLAAAEEAGSQFIVTPGITRDLLEASVASDIPLLQVSATPPELWKATVWVIAVSNCSRRKSVAAWQPLKRWAAPLVK